MSDKEQQEWIFVKPKKNKKIQKEIKPERIFTKGAYKPIQEHQMPVLSEKFISSPAYHHNQTLLSKIFSISAEEIQVQCLGLGNFSSQIKPYIQLLFLKFHIISLLQQRKISFTVNVFDPAFTEKEICLIKANEWSCEPLKANKKGKYFIFFLPHCQRFLHEEVCILRNGASQGSWLIIGNSLEQYKQRCQALGEPIPAAFEGKKPVETKLMDFEQALNDTYVYEL